ncbi:AAA family ATPase [Actinocrispum sp. NPDC049592]|uniref:ATP-binding protein n=1 Tax=Actinocrispum sp. NPDC049592 TaxID=3154835 RepID=UPI0034387181
MGLSRLVGRRAEVELLGDRRAAAFAGSGQVVLVAGEPGIGKTRLAQELGATAVWGRAVQDDGSPPYWPFRQVLRTLATRHPAGQLTSDLALIAPEVGAGPTRPITSAEERFRVFEAVTEYLVTAAEADGLLIVLDDVHWADPPTLHLLVHLARSIRSSKLLILAAYRDTEAHEAMSETLASLSREDTVTRIRLRGLTEAEVATQLAGLTGAPVADDVAAKVTRQSHGNPFFVAELGRLIHGTDELPDAVRDAVRARLKALSDHEVLRAGSLLASLDPGVLAEVLQRPLAEVLSALDEAAQAGLVDGRRFVHDLVREAARLDLPTALRLDLHRRIAVHFGQRGDSGTRVAEIAHHWLESLPAGDPVKAAEWAERAADMAMAQLAWENASILYSRTLAAFPDLKPRARASLLCRLGIARLRRFDVIGGEEALREAAASAREAGDSNALAEVALAMEAMSSAEWNNTGKALCDEALAALPRDDNPLRSRLLAQRAAEGAFTGAPEVDELSREALGIAGRTGDPQALRSALRARQLACSGPDGVHERLSLADRMLALGVADDDAEALLWGRMWRFDAYCQLGRLDDAEAQLAAIGEAAARIRTAVAQWHHVRAQAAIAHARGNFERARELADTALDLVKDTGGSVVTQVTVTVVATVAGMTGDEAGVLEEYGERYLFHPPEIVASLIGGWHASCGRLDIARRCYHPQQVHDVIGGMRFLPVMAGLVVLATTFEDKATAQAAYERLLPYGELITCGGAGVVTLNGAVHGVLGLAAAAVGRLDDAVRHYRQALVVNERSGMRPHVATVGLDLARVLIRRRRPGDRDEALALATSVAAQAEALGMRPLLAQARELTGNSSDPLSKREQEIAVLVGQGLTNRQIAAATHISVRTVETHVQHILAKLGLSTRTQIAAWAAKN